MDSIFTKSHTDPIVIGIDHGFGNIKTAHYCFRTGVAAYEKEPTFKSNLLIFDGMYYLIGEEHKEFRADKMQDQDYYILTLAAIAQELKVRETTSANGTSRRRFTIDMGQRTKGAIQSLSASKEFCGFPLSGH